MSQRILLTGGTGFFGRALLRHFLDCYIQSSVSLSILTRHPDRFIVAYPELTSSDHITLLQGDILDRDSLPCNHRFTHILHAATDSTTGPRLSPIQRFDQIVDGTRNILDLAVETGAVRLLLTSSGGIYGTQPSDLPGISEDWIGSPSLDVASTAYSQGKRAAEHLCALYRDQHCLESVIARCFTFVGQDLPLNAHFAIGNFIFQALYADEITVTGDGTPIRSYLDQRDLARWLWMLMFNGNDGETYNVGSDCEISILDLAHLVRDLLSPSKSVVVLGGDSSQSLGRNRYIPNVDKIKAHHSITAMYSLEESILYTAKMIQ